MLFILDSITVAATGSVTARVAKELMKRLKLICGRYNVTVITLMHTRKRDKSKPIEMQDLAGSAKLTDLADNVLAIAKCNATEVYVKVLKSRSNAIPDKVRHFEIRSDGYLHLEFIRECEEEDLLAQGKSKLTPEVEQEILTLRGKGYSVRKIADHMKLSNLLLTVWFKSIRTVKNPARMLLRMHNSPTTQPDKKTISCKTFT